MDYICYYDIIAAVLLFMLFALTFYYYVLTLTKPKNTRILTAITYITSLIIVTVLLPTPITHWGIYFDAQKKYQHGFLFSLLYICSLFLLVCAFFVYLQNRKKINRYQIVSILLEIDKSILWSAMENRKHLLFYVIRQKCTAIICRVTCILNRFRKVIISHFCKDIYDYQIKTPTICIKQESFEDM